MTLQDIESVVSHPISIDHDDEGKPRYLGFVRGTPLCVVVALDEPDLIVTIFRRERW